MKGLILTILIVVLCLVVVGADAHTAEAAKKVAFPEVPRITKEELKPMLGNPDVIILDVRPYDQWEVSDQKLPGAVYENPERVEAWAKNYPKDKTLVFY